MCSAYVVHKHKIPVIGVCVRGVAILSKNNSKLRLGAALPLISLLAKTLETFASNINTHTSDVFKKYMVTNSSSQMYLDPVNATF